MIKNPRKILRSGAKTLIGCSYRATARQACAKYRYPLFPSQSFAISVSFRVTTKAVRK